MDNPVEFEPPSPGDLAALLGQQRALHRALAERDERLARLYLGALMVLQQERNPSRLSLAAHGLRELLNGLSAILDAPVPPRPPSLKEKVLELSTRWERARRSNCYCDGKLQGEIDAHLGRALDAIQEFFAWFSADLPTRRERTATILRGLDPIARRLPGTIERLRVDEWGHCHDFFTGVAHQRTPGDFDKWLDCLERMLLDRLQPRTYEDHAL